MRILADQGWNISQKYTVSMNFFDVFSADKHKITLSLCQAILFDVLQNR